ncbi:hypothetical protein EBR96_06280, partial [bacterium]|nr:hypothetical protein [bacterium]
NSADDIVNFRQLNDVSVSSYNNLIGQSVVVNGSGTGLTFADTSGWDKNAADDITQFSRLTDVAVTSYNNVQGYYVAVNSGGSGLTFVNPSGVGVGNASQLSGLTASQFARSDAATLFTGGTFTVQPASSLVIASGATLNVDGGSVLISGQPLGQLALQNQVDSGQIANIAIRDFHIAPAAAINWSKISKIGSSLGDLQTRSASDINSGTLGPQYYDALSNLNLFERIATSTESLGTTLVSKQVADNLYIQKNASTAVQSGVTFSIGVGATLNVDGALVLSGQPIKAVFPVLSNNLSDVPDKALSRQNLGLGAASSVVFNGLTLATGLTVSTGNFTGQIDGQRISLSNGISAVTGNFTGQVDGVRLNLSNGINAVTGNFTGQIDGVRLNLSDGINAVTGNFSSQIVANTVTVNGTVSANMFSAVTGNFTGGIVFNPPLGISGKINSTGGILVSPGPNSQFRVNTNRGNILLIADGLDAFVGISSTESVTVTANKGVTINTIGANANIVLRANGSGGRVISSGASSGSYAVILENTAPFSEGAGVVNIKAPRAGKHDNANYIGFTAKDDYLIGAISIQNGGSYLADAQGVKLESRGADYAEYLERQSTSEKIGPADIVGVYHGKITRKTEGAQRVMAVSTMPIVLGNWKGKDSSKKYDPVAFIGQVPVRVVGKVRAGDLVIPSGKEDGTGVAVEPADLTPEQLDSVVGQAWESSDDTDEKILNVAILPVNKSAALLQIMRQTNAEFRKETDALKAELAELKSAIESLKPTK